MYALAKKITMYHHITSLNKSVPCYFLACGEVEEDWPVHDVDLCRLCRRHTVHGILNVLKLNQRLPHAWHHCQVTACKQQQQQI